MQPRTYKSGATSASGHGRGGLPGRRLLTSAAPLVLFAAAANCLLADDAQKQPAAAQRRYDKGPLTPEDFRAKVPAAESGNKTHAFVTTNISFQYGYELAPRGAGGVAKLTNIDMFAMVLPEDSWNPNPKDAMVLDHAQGHFDITAIFAGRVLLGLVQKMRRGQAPQGVGASAAAATADLEKKLQAAIQDVSKELTQAQVRYDTVTRHGADAAAQQRERRQQRSELDALARALKKAAKSRAGR